MSCQKGAGTHFLEETGVEAEPDSQCLLFLEKLLLKVPHAVDSDSVACQCLNCSVLLPPFPKCSYCITNPCSRLAVSQVLFKPQNGDFPVPLDFPVWCCGCDSLSAPSFPHLLLTSPQALQQLCAEHPSQGGRLLGVTLGSPISVPFLLHHNTFSLSMFVAGKHLRLFFLVKMSS